MNRNALRTTIAFAAVLATGPVFIASTASAAPATTARATTAAEVPSDLTLVATRTSLLGTHTWYAQTFHGLPVVDGYYGVHSTRSGALTSVDDGRQAVPATLSTTPSVPASGASAAARSAVSARAGAEARSAVVRAAKDAPMAPAAGNERAVLSVLGGSSPALVWSIVSTSDSGTSRTLVDARTGAVHSVTTLSKNADGKGQVFDPNPVVTLRNESLKDHGDKDQAVLRPAYKKVTLKRLGTSGHLVGTWAKVVRAKGGLATSAARTFVYTRADDRFEQVNAYSGIDAAQAYLQKLGFRDVNNHAQKLSIDTYSGDNSFYDPSNHLITYGTGGIDDAEDLEVVWHEYGHAVQDDQVPGFGRSEQAGAMGEGFGDYLAVTMSQASSNGYDIPCVMDWDSTSYTSRAPHCLRRTDTGKTTDDLAGEVHDDGEIWSNALWDINQSVGRDRANRIIIEAQFSFSPGTSFAAAARKTVATAKALYGAQTAGQVRAAFVLRKIL